MKRTRMRAATIIVCAALLTPGATPGQIDVQERLQQDANGEARPLNKYTRTETVTGLTITPAFGKSFFLEVLDIPLGVRLSGIADYTCQMRFTDVNTMVIHHGGPLPEPIGGRQEVAITLHRGQNANTLTMHLKSEKTLTDKQVDALFKTLCEEPLVKAQKNIADNSKHMALLRDPDSLTAYFTNYLRVTGTPLKGTSKDELRAVLGPPDSINRLFGQDYWTYEIPTSNEYVNDYLSIYFDSNGLVKDFSRI